MNIPRSSIVAHWKQFGRQSEMIGKASYNGMSYGDQKIPCRINNTYEVNPMANPTRRTSRNMPLVVIIAAVMLISSSVLGLTTARAQSSTDFSINWQITSAEPLALGKVNTLFFDATAADDGVRITLEDTNPLVANPAAFGLWTGFTELAHVHQETNVTFTQAVTTTISGQLKLQKGDEVQYLSISKTLVVLAENHGNIKLIQLTQPTAGKTAKFSAVAISESGPKFWNAFRLSLTCDSGFSYHDFNVAVPVARIQSVQGDFDAMMPPTADHCVWTGSGAADGQLFSFQPMAFDVVPPASPWHLTLSVNDGPHYVDDLIVYTAEVSHTGILPGAEFRAYVVLNSSYSQGQPFDILTRHVANIGPVAPENNTLTLYVQSRAIGTDNDFQTLAEKTITFAGAPKPNFRVSAYLPLVTR